MVVVLKSWYTVESPKKLLRVFLRNVQIQPWGLWFSCPGVELTVAFNYFPRSFQCVTELGDAKNSVGPDKEPGHRLGTCQEVFLCSTPDCWIRNSRGRTQQLVFDQTHLVIQRHSRVWEPLQLNNEMICFLAILGYLEGLVLVESESGHSFLKLPAMKTISLTLTIM